MASRRVISARTCPTFTGLRFDVSAAMFATIHRSPLNYFHTGVLGALCGWLTVRSGSVWPAVLVHTAWNTTMVLIDA